MSTKQRKQDESEDSNRSSDSPRSVKSHRTHKSDKSRVSDKSYRPPSRASKHNVSISDVELDDDSHLKKKVKKLKHDKKTLKEKIRSLIDNAETRIGQQKTELVQTEEYYREKLSDVARERDKALEDLDNTRSQMLLQSENLSMKMDRQKTDIQKRYDSQIVKRLEDTIVKLQEKLTKQLDEREKIKEEAENYYHSKETTYLNKISDLENHLSLYRDQISKLNSVIRNFETTKELEIRSLVQGKADELQKVLSEYKGKTSSLEAHNAQLEKLLTEANRKADREIQDGKLFLSSMKTELENKTLEVLSKNRETSEKIKQEFEGKIQDLERVHREQIQTLNLEHIKKLQAQEFQFKKEYSVAHDRFSDEKEALKNELDSLNKKFSDLSNSNEPQKKLEELKNKITIEYTSEIGKLQSVLKERDLQIRDLKLKREKNVGELEDILTKTKEEKDSLGLNLKKAQDHVSNITAQFNVSCNKQKEEYLQTLYEKETLIAELRKHCRELGMESTDKINNLERRLNSVLEEKDVLTKTISNYKAEQTKIENELVTWKERHRTQFGSAMEYEESIQKIKLERDLFENKFRILEPTINAKEAEIGRLVQNLVLHRNAEKEHMETRVHHLKELEALKSELVHKQKQADQFCSELGSLREEYNKTVRSMEALRLKELNDQKKEYNKSVGDLNAQIQLFDRSTKDLESKRVQLATELSGVVFEREKYKKSTDDYAAELARLRRAYDDNCTELQNLKTTLLGMTKESKDRERELLIAKQQSVIVKMKDGQLTTLATQLTALQQTHRHSIDKITSEHKREKDELIMLKEIHQKNAKKLQEYPDLKLRINNIEEETNLKIRRIESLKDKQIYDLQKKVADYETQVLTHNRHIEEMKMEFLKKMPSIDGIPRDFRDKFEALEKENSELKKSLIESEKKLKEVSTEAMSKSIALDFQLKHLQEREVELKNKENQPPVLLDPEIRKERDNALIELRKCKVELARFKSRGDKVVDQTGDQS